MPEYDIIDNMICWRCIHTISVIRGRPFCRLLGDIPDPDGSCEEELYGNRFKDRGYDVRQKYQKKSLGNT